MNQRERQKFIVAELEAICEEIDHSVNSLVLSKRFLHNLVAISKCAEPNYKTLNEIVKRIK